jgi:hypothetical protein
MQGRVAADYPIPPNAPQGDVRIASYGITDVSPKNSPNEIHRALHLRIVVADNGPTPWTFDTREQRLDLSGHGPIAPAFASANSGAPPPLVTVDPNAKRIVDLFFLLPSDVQHADVLPEFDALWRVTTASGVVVERTPFERLMVEPDYGGYDDWDYGPNYYWGGPFWMNGDWSYAGAPYENFSAGVMIHRSGAFGRGGFHGGGRGGGGGHGGGGHGGGGHR